MSIALRHRRKHSTMSHSWACPMSVSVETEGIKCEIIFHRWPSPIVSPALFFFNFFSRSLCPSHNVLTPLVHLPTIVSLVSAAEITNEAKREFETNQNESNIIFAVHVIYKRGERLKLLFIYSICSTCVVSFRHDSRTVDERTMILNGMCSLWVHGTDTNCVHVSRGACVWIKGLRPTCDKSQMWINVLNDYISKIVALSCH